MNDDEENVRKFGHELVELFEEDGHHPLLIAGMLMKTSMEIYTKLLDDDAIYSLLNAVASSVKDIRNNSNENRTIHQKEENYEGYLTTKEMATQI